MTDEYGIIPLITPDVERKPKMHFTHNNSGVCSRSVSFDIAPDHTVTGITFIGGCHGNTQGVAALAEGMKAEEIIERCSGIRCGAKFTSCPDQLAKALEKAIAELDK